MRYLGNQRGSVLVFVTLMAVLLMIMVGMGLDTGQLAFSRTTGQTAVDAAALSAISALPSRLAAQVEARATAFNSQNDYVGSSGNALAAANVGYVKYDFTTHTITNYSEPIATANGVRVALEDAASMKNPAFLTRLFNVFGQTMPTSNNVSVSAVAVATTIPSLPIAIWSDLCGADGVQKDNQSLKFQNPNEKKAETAENSCWTTYLDCSSGASDIKALFTAAQQCSGAKNAGVQIGTPICQNRGSVTSSLHEADQFFTKDYPNRWWLVPVINGGNNCAPENPTKVVNWAVIRPSKVDDTGNPKTITADVICDPSLQQQIIADNLCYSYRLVREPAKGM